MLTALEDKKTRPFERVALNLVLPTVNGEAIGSVNTVIRRHNEVCDDFQSRIAAARTRLESHWVAMALADFARLGGAAKAADQAAKIQRRRSRALSGKSRSSRGRLSSISSPLRELNRDLHSYLGHDELRLKVRDTGYSIMRHDAVADALSEGETTAIALLYFLKSLCDRRFDLTKGVVVLDDPVSSLDANALYSAFGYIQERTQQAGQLFVLTHNFCFFRQVCYWFHRLGKRGKRGVNNRPARFYMLDCVDDADGRHAVLRGLDPLLERYDSEYHYLFACIYRAAIAPPTPGLERNYVLANLGRRLLESFLAFRLPQSTSELWQKLQLVKFDEAKKIRILRFLHTHSHSAAIAEPDHDLSLLGGETHRVLIDLLALIRSQDADHHDAMVSLVTALDAEEDEAEEVGSFTRRHEPDFLPIAMVSAESLAERCCRYATCMLTAAQASPSSVRCRERTAAERSPDHPAFVLVAGGGHLVHGAAAEARQVQRHVGVAQAALSAADDLVARVQRAAAQLVGRHLDAGERCSWSRTRHWRKPRSRSDVLGLLDARELPGRDAAGRRARGWPGRPWRACPRWAGPAPRRRRGCPPWSGRPPAAGCARPARARPPGRGGSRPCRRRWRR